MDALEGEQLNDVDRTYAAQNGGLVCPFTPTAQRTSFDLATAGACTELEDIA